MLGPEVLGVPKMIDPFATRGKAGLLIYIQHLNAVLDSLVECKFTASSRSRRTTSRGC